MRARALEDTKDIVEEAIWMEAAAFQILIFFFIAARNAACCSGVMFMAAMYRVTCVEVNYEWAVFKEGKV
jgi:hypothetical protein